MGAWDTRPRFLQSRMPKAEEIGARVVSYRNVQSSVSANQLTCMWFAGGAYVCQRSTVCVYAQEEMGTRESAEEVTAVDVPARGLGAEGRVFDVKELLKKALHSPRRRWASDRLVIGSLSDSHSDLRSGVSRCSSGLSVDLYALVLSS